MIPLFTITKGFPTIYPPLFIIVMISMIKDGYENYQHFMSDQAENQKKVDVIDPFITGGKKR